MNPEQVAEVDENGGHENAKGQCKSFEELAAIPVPQYAKAEVEVDIEQLSIESWANTFARRKRCARSFGAWCELANVKAIISENASDGRVSRDHGLDSVDQEDVAVLVDIGDEMSWHESQQHIRHTGHNAPAYYEDVDRSCDRSLDRSLERQQHDRLIEEIMSAAMVGPHFLEQQLLNLHKSGDLDDG